MSGRSTGPADPDRADGGGVEGAATTPVDPVATTVEPLGTGQYVGYAAGDAANNLTFSMVSAFLLIYYTDVAGISAATAGTLFLVVRIWGGVADLTSPGAASTGRPLGGAGSGPTCSSVRCR